MPATERKIARQSHEVRGDKVVWIFDQLFLSQLIGQKNDRVIAYKSQRQAANAFDDRVCAFKKHAYFKNLMDTTLVHVCPNK